MYRTSSDNKLNRLLKTSKKIFKTGDLGILWDIKDKNTLWTTLSRYKNKGYLYRIHRGLYSKVAVEDLDDFELGCGVGGSFSYISTETVLQRDSVISQDISEITVVGQETASFGIKDRQVNVRKMNDKYLQNRTGINENENYSISTLERAAADIMYYSPNYYFDNPKLINWEEVNRIKKEIGY